MACAYGEAGAQVLPLHSPADTLTGCDCGRRACSHPAKHPRTLHGLADATTDMTTIRRWWRMWPSANVGIRPWPGQVVLDVDPRHGGYNALAGLLARHGATMPRTRMASTGSGGAHWWLWLPGDLVGRLGEGLDVKTASGYLVVPPSVHASGGRYAWVDDGPVAEAPAWLAGLLRRPVRRVQGVAGSLSPARLAGLLRVVTDAPEGTRNDRLNWAAHRAARAGADLTPFVRAGLAVGLSQREVERTVESARAGAGVSG